MIDNEDKILQDTFDKLYRSVADLMIKDSVDPQIVAATLASHALKLYKQILTEEDFLKMIDSIHQSGKMMLAETNRTLN